MGMHPFIEVSTCSIRFANSVHSNLVRRTKLEQDSPLLERIFLDRMQNTAKLRNEAQQYVDKSNDLKKAYTKFREAVRIRAAI